MQRETPQNHPSTTLNPLKDATGVVSVDYTAHIMHYLKKSIILKPS